jgi:DNA-binding NarL/FixJ family response regulator
MKARLLVVDDEALFATAIQDGLAALGYDVPAIACNAAEALIRAEETEPDLVLMDIKLGGAEDGIDAAEKILKRFGIPTIYVTAFADAETVRKASAAGAFGYVKKPVDADGLHAAIQTALPKAMEQRKLRERGAIASSTLRSLAVAVVVLELKGRPVFLNPRAEELLRCTLPEAFQQPFSRLFTILSAEDRSGIRLPFSEARGPASSWSSIPWYADSHGTAGNGSNARAVPRARQSDECHRGEPVHRRVGGGRPKAAEAQGDSLRLRPLGNPRNAAHGDGTAADHP